MNNSTTTTRSYSDLLKDPRWQKKRLQIMDRDNYKCQLCGDVHTTLTVHHISYNGKEPWEQDDSELITLCECCHAFMEKNKNIHGLNMKDIKAMHLRWREEGYNIRLYKYYDLVLLYIFSPFNRLLMAFDIQSDLIEDIKFFIS